MLLGEDVDVPIMRNVWLAVDDLRGLRTRDSALDLTCEWSIKSMSGIFLVPARPVWAGAVFVEQWNKMVNGVN